MSIRSIGQQHSQLTSGDIFVQVEEAAKTSGTVREEEASYDREAISLKGRSTVIEYRGISEIPDIETFGYKIILLPKDFRDRTMNFEEKKKIEDLLDIRKKGRLIEGFNADEIDSLICTVSSCIEIDKISQHRWAHHFYLVAIKNAIKFLNEFSEIHEKFSSREGSKAIEVIDFLLKGLSEFKFPNSKELDLLIESLIKLTRVQIEGERADIIVNFISGGRKFLFEHFLRYYEKKNADLAKTIFFSYVQSLDLDYMKAQDCDDIKQAQVPLQEIFKSLKNLSYVPYNCSNVEEMTKGMIFSIYVDLFLMDFLYQFEEKIIKKSDKTPFDMKKVKIDDWKLLRPFPPEDLSSRRKIYLELLSATSHAKLNSVGEIQITCRNQIEFSVGQKKNLRIQSEVKKDTAQKMVREGEVLTRLVSSDRKDDAIDRRLHSSVKGTKESAVEDDKFSENKQQLNRDEERVTGATLSISDRQRDQFLSARERAFEKGNHWQVSHADAEEGEVEITDTSQERNERSEAIENSTKKRSQVVKDHDKGGGWSVLGFISSRNRDKKTTTDAEEEGVTTKEGSSALSEREQGAKISEARKKEHQQSVAGEQMNRENRRSQAEVALEKSKECSQDQRVTLLSKTGEDSIAQLRKKHGLKQEKTNIQDSEESSKVVQSIDEQREEQYSVRNSFNFEQARSTVELVSEEYTQDFLSKKTLDTTEAFALKQGYLLISKVEYMRKTILTPVKFVVEMEYHLQDDRVKNLKKDEIPDYLHPLHSCIHSVAKRRFHITLYDMKIEGSSPIVKNLALEVWNDERATRDRANSLNIIFHRLGRFLDSICDRPLEQAWVQYHFHKNSYIEEASLKYCDDATRSLQGMFMAFQGDPVVSGSEQFLRLHSEFQGLVSGAISSQRHLSLPNKDSGILFHKEAAAGILLGQKQLTLQDSFKNLLVVGSVGCGKTSKIIIPNLLQLDNCSILVTDVDGEIYDKTAGLMERKGFNVKVINIQGGGADGDCFNPLDHLTSESYDDIRQSVDCIMKARGFDETKAEKDAFWVIGGKMVLELALRLTLNDQSEGKVEKVTLAALHKKVGCLTKEEIEAFAETKETEGKKVESEALKLMAQSVLSSGNSFSDRASYAKSAVEYCSSPIVQKLTHTSTINLSQIRKKPTVIYLKISQTQLSQYQFLLSLFYTRFFSTCYKESRVAANSSHSLLPVICLMDEFGHTPIPDFHTILTTNRKHEISVVAVVQSISQVMELYGEKNGSTMLGGGFASKLYFALDPSDVQIARDMSDAYGKVRDKTGKTFEASGLVSHREEEKEGLSIEEIMYPGGGNATFIHTGYKPIKLRLLPYFEDERFQGLKGGKLQQTSVLKSTFSKTGLFSKEEAIEELVSVLREKKPTLNVQMVKKTVHSEDKTKITSYLLRQGFVLEPKITQIIDEIYAKRSILLECPRFASLDKESQENISSCLEIAKSVTKENLPDILIEILDLLYEKGFRHSEIIALKEINELIAKNLELAFFIIKDLHLQYRLNRGGISQEEILGGLEKICGGFTRDETAGYWKSLIEYIQASVKQICENKLIQSLEQLLVLTCIERLIQLYPFSHGSVRKLEAEKVINELRKFSVLKNLLHGHLLVIDGEAWRVIKVSVVNDSLIHRIEIQKEKGNTEITRIIRFDRENGSFSIYKTKAQ